MEKKEEDKFREEVKTWMTEEFDKAFKDLETNKPKDATYTPLKVIHMSSEIIITNKHNNRVQFDAEYDFSLIKQILVSKETKCPFKTGYSYVTVILWAGEGNYFMFPYVFKEKIKKKGKNNLKNWTFINKNMQQANHSISSYQQL